MKNFKLNLNSKLNNLKKNKLYKKTNIFLENVQNRVSFFHLKKKLLKKYKEFYEENFKISYLAFIFSLFFFYYLIYLSFPGILHSKKDQTVWTRVCIDSRYKLFNFT